AFLQKAHILLPPPLCRPDARCRGKFVIDYTVTNGIERHPFLELPPQIGDIETGLINPERRANAGVVLVEFEGQSGKKGKEVSRGLRMVNNDAERGNFLMDLSLVQPEIQPHVMLTCTDDDLS